MQLPDFSIVQETTAELEEDKSALPALPQSVTGNLMLPRAVALSQAAALPLPASPQHLTPEAPARHSGNAKVGVIVPECYNIQVVLIKSFTNHFYLS